MKIEERCTPSAISSRLSEPENPKQASRVNQEEFDSVEHRKGDTHNNSKILGYLQKEDEITSRTDFTINILKKRLAEAKKETERVWDDQLQIQVSNEYQLKNILKDLEIENAAGRCSND